MLHVNCRRGLISIGSAEQRKLNEANIKKTTIYPSENFPDLRYVYITGLLSTMCVIACGKHYTIEVEVKVRALCRVERNVQEKHC